MSLTGRISTTTQMSLSMTQKQLSTDTRGGRVAASRGGCGDTQTGTLGQRADANYRQADKQQGPPVEHRTKLPIP